MQPSATPPVNRQQGNGRLGFIITLAVFVSGIFAAVKVVPVRIDAYQFREALREEARYASVHRQDSRIRERISNAKRADGSPLYPPLTIFSLLVFYIYALQCLPTTIVVRSETRSWRWALGQLAGMSVFAYLASLLVYQMGTLWGL